MEAKTLELSNTPYPGLRPFRSDEADIFFGRERQTDDLLSRLAEHRFLAVVGPSGCGKSSLVAAGLMPALAAGFMATAGAHWRVAKLRPGERPLMNLASALVEAGILDDERAAQPDAQVFLEAALRRGPLGLIEILRGSALAPDTNLLVLVDQFEELFRFSAGVQRDEAEAFVALLLGSAAAPRERIYIAITMRSDFLGECAPFHGLPEAINDGLYLTPRLTRDECAACITGPARVFDADIEPALVNRLLNDFGPDPDQLPLLQHALLRMWNQHEPDRQSGAKTVLGVADYEAIGGLARSLSDHANEAFGELDPDHQRIAQLMFRRLSDSETARRDRRAPAHVSEIAELAGATIDDVRRVADVFRRRDRCFLMPRDGVELTPDTVLDVSHESLLRQWDRAAGWIEEEADAVTAYRRLRDAARAWRDGDTPMTGARLDRALAWRGHATTNWARRYGTDDDFRSVCDFIGASEQARTQRARVVRIRRSIALSALGVLAVAGVLGWFCRPLLYVWEHTTYYASTGRREGAPCGLGELTKDQVRHRPLSYRVATAGLLGRVLRIDAVNSQDELTEIDPEYGNAQRGRRLRTARWVYVYDATGEVAAEHQYTSRNELVQSKVYVPLDKESARLAVFIGADGTPIPVHGRSNESTYYWAEKLGTSKTDAGYATTISYLGASGEPVPGQDRAFATIFRYDRRGHMTSMTSLDASGRPMDDIAGRTTLVRKTDVLGNELEAIAFDDQGRRTRIRAGWSIRRTVYDAFGNEIEEAYFDEIERPTITKDGWHKQRFTRNERGSVVETRYFDRDGKPTYDVELSCHGYKQARDAMDRPTRQTCIGADGQRHKTRFGYVTFNVKYDDQGRVQEEATLDGDDHPTASSDAYAIRRYSYDRNGRTTEISYWDSDGKPINSNEGYGRSITTYDDSGLTEWTHFLGIDGRPIVLKNGYASVMRKRDISWNLIEERYFDEYGHRVITNDGYAGWRGTFDSRGQKIETVYLGKLDEALLGKNGYAGWRAAYDDLGRTITVHYLGLTKEPVANVVDGITGWQSRYDGRGREVERTYFGLDGHPVTSLHGEAGWRAEYDPRGNQTRLQYVDIRAAPTLHVWNDESSFKGRGYSSLTRKFDDHGELVEEAYFGAHEERVLRPEGWSYASHAYDAFSRRTRTSYFGTTGEAVTLREGYHAVASTYDDRGDAIEIRYLGIDDTPVVAKWGVARITLVYDQHRHAIEQSVFGARNEPVTRSNGAHRTVMIWDDHGRQTREEYWGSNKPPNKLGAMEYRYDLWGNVIEQRHLDAADKPYVTADEPCAITAWRFSNWQELIEETCRGADGALSPHLPNSAARVAFKYGLPREKIEETYFDEHDLPFTRAHGFAGVRYRYDSLGREAEVIYLDARGGQILNERGYARIAKKYDARGDLVEQAYFLANDSPTTPVARVESDFDALRRKIKDRYIGPGGTPALLHGNGQHVTLYEYDAYGNVRALRYLDAQGHPTRGYARDFIDSFEGNWQLCARWVAKYRDDGELIENGKCEPALPAGDPGAL